MSQQTDTFSVIFAHGFYCVVDASQEVAYQGKLFRPAQKACRDLNESILNEEYEGHWSEWCEFVLD